MSFERPIGPGVEAAVAPSPAEVQGLADGEVPTSAKLQILSTEHYSLMSSRALAWNEAFSRAGMFLSTLSGSIVALALVAQASEFGEGFRVFGLVILPVVLLVGIGTVLRMGVANYHDALCVVGMNRIRAAYLEMAPDLERYFVMGTTDDERGVSNTMATPPGTSLFVQMFGSAPMLLSVLNSILFGAILWLLALQLGMGTVIAIALAVVAFITGMLAFLWFARAQIGHAHAQLEPRFLSRSDG